MEIVGAVAGVMSCLCAQNCLHAPIAERCKLMRNPKNEIEKLNSLWGQLKAQDEDVKMRLRRVQEQEGKEPTREVQLWLENAQKVVNEVQNINEEIHVERRCLNGFFPNYCSRLNSGRCIAKKIKELTKLLEKGQFSDESLATLLPERGMKLPTTTLVGKTTAERNLEMIWDCLMDEEVQRIGVYGMGGVGKTTIVTHINNRLLKEIDRFDNVIWVTVSKASNIVKLQNDIAEAVKLDLSKYEDPMRKKGELLKTFEQRKRLVLILDDMWEAFRLEEIGIPEPTRENRCKLVLTTRSSEVCRQMGCEKNIIKVEVLSDEEAWDLFMDKVGRYTVLSPEVEQIAKDVAKECAHLPLAIITIGGSLSGVDNIHEWRDALNDLRESTKGVEDMEREVFERLKFSYSRLKDEKVQQCFIYCALYPEDYNIPTEELIEYWIVEGLIEDQGNRQVVLDKGQRILNKLKYNSMLESIIEHNLLESDAIEYVKMHDLIRDMALHIIRTSYPFMVKAGEGLKELPDEEEWAEDLERVSLMRNNIRLLSCSPRCPKLSTLLLHENPSLHIITNHFFVHLHGLKVLNLSATMIHSLPDSIYVLGNLRALLLGGCRRLTRVPLLAQLKALRVLDLHDTAIKELPRGMESLVNLKCLNLSNMDGLRRILDGSITEFSVLELLSLTELENLSVSFFDLSAFNSYVRSKQCERLKNFQLTVNDPWLHIIDASTKDILHFSKRYVVLLGCHLISNEYSLVLPNNTQLLFIYGCPDLTRLSKLSGLKNVMQLTICCLESCIALECILSIEHEEEEVSLQNLEYLRLVHLRRLGAFYKGVSPHGTFPSLNLKRLDVYYCHNLKNLFSPRLLQHLQNLEEVSVHECGQIEELIAEEERGKGSSNSSNNNNTSAITLPRLRKLDLKKLLHLKNIWRGVMVCDSLHTVEVISCRQLKRLPLFDGEDQSPPPALKEIFGKKEWWDSLEWDQSYAKILLQPFFKQDKLYPF